MNNKGFAISIILYSMVFLLISILYILLGILRTRYSINIKLRENLIEELDESNILGEKVDNFCKRAGITYVEKYNNDNGLAIDAPDGSGDNDVCFYTSANSSNLAGQYGNVIFGNFCWQIVRTTSTGGIKLIYNGPVGSGQTCYNDSSKRPSSVGITGSSGTRSKSVVGNKLYGTSFEIYNTGTANKFQLLDTFTANWNGDYDNDGVLDYSKIMGNYACGTSSTVTGSSDTCDYLYYIGHYQSATEASVERYSINNNNTNFSQIGTSTYNAYNDNAAIVGYMYNEVYNYMSRTYYSSADILTKTTIGTSVQYYYGDKATWNSETNMYDLTVDDGNGNYVTPTSTSTWSSVRSNALGKYTCLSSTETSCATVYYIVANSSSSYVYYFALSNNESADTKAVTWTVGTGYSENNGTYSLTGTSTVSFLLKDWYTNYNNASYKNFYICDNFTSSTCTNEVYYLGDTSNYQISYNKSSNKYMYAHDVEYVNGEYKLKLDDATNSPYLEIWDWYKQYSTNMYDMHYTCFGSYNKETNSCGGGIYYIYYTSSTNSYYIYLSNGEKVSDAIQKMLNINNLTTSNINKYKSAVSGILESWYKKNLYAFRGFMDSDAVFCNDRNPKTLSGWNLTGVTIRSIEFNAYSQPTKAKASLSCNNITDRFSVNNDIAKLKYPIGLLTDHERAMMDSYYAKTGQSYWTMSPFSYGHSSGYVSAVSSSGTRTSGTTSAYGIRPVIVISGDISVAHGSGTYDDPYFLNTVQ